ncbi:hypothetical protein AAVH_15739 [Aphelenchoides avenae]|nr:hypothetical protein AAVH_15739 [Aphelenchus avenae]
MSKQDFIAEKVPIVLRRINLPKLDLPEPFKIYRVEHGATIDKILGVKRMGSGVVAMVAYADKTMEIVPTHVIGDNQPEILLAFYEARLHRTLKEELKKADDVAQQLPDLADGDDAKKD